jgi:hypothetical protein
VSCFTYCYAERNYARCYYAECRYAECCYDECRGAVTLSRMKLFIQNIFSMVGFSRHVFLTEHSFDVDIFSTARIVRRREREKECVSMSLCASECVFELSMRCVCMCVN